MDWSTPCYLVFHHLPEFVQTHVHWGGDVIQPSHPLLPPSPPALNLSQHQGISTESALCNKWPKYRSISFSISPSNEYKGLISFPLGLTGLISLQSKGLSRAFSSTTLQKHQFLGTQPSLCSNSYIHSWLWEKKNQKSFDYMDLCWQRCFSTF